MKQQHIDRIKKLVTDKGIIHTINVFGGNKDIIRKTYIRLHYSFLTPVPFHYTTLSIHTIIIYIFPPHLIRSPIL